LLGLSTVCLPFDDTFFCENMCAKYAECIKQVVGRGTLT
jgi:hypothetical protein